MLSNVINWKLMLKILTKVDKQVGLSRATLEFQVKVFILIIVKSQVRVLNRLNLDWISSWSRKLPITFQTPSRLLSDTFQTPYRHFPDLPNTSQEPFYIFISLKDPVPKSQVTRRVGGWVVVYRYIIMPLCGPTCKMVLARIQFRLHSMLDPSVAINNMENFNKLVKTNAVFAIFI